MELYAEAFNLDTIHSNGRLVTNINRRIWKKRNTRCADALNVKRKEDDCFTLLFYIKAVI